MRHDVDARSRDGATKPPTGYLRRAMAVGAAIALLAAGLAPRAVAQNRIVYNDLPLFVSGSNIAWVNFGADIGPGTTNFAKFAAFFDSVKANGGNAMRFWLHTNGASSPAYGPDGRVTGPGTGTIADLRQILDLAWERRIGLLLCLWSFDMTGTSYGSALAQRNRTLLTDSAAREAYLVNCLTPMVEALRGHPAILAWEMFNEPEGMSDEFGWSGYLHVPMRDIQIFVNRAAGIIHRVDTLAKVTTGAEGFYSLSDVTTPAAASADGGTDAPSAQERAAIESLFEARHGFHEPAERILGRTGSLANFNFYRDDRLIEAGGDPDGTLDFYTVHYYQWAGTKASPFHHPYEHWGLTKPLILAEFYAQPTFGVAAADLFSTLRANGYAGALTWQWINSTQQAATKPLLRDFMARFPADVRTVQVPGEIYLFSASAEAVEAGSPCTISWSAAQGALVTLNGVPVPHHGDTVVTPFATTEYILSATGAVTETRSVTVSTGVSDAGGVSTTPYRYSLSQNYPNPFNPVTAIRYSIAERSEVRLTVYDLTGREVAAIVDGEMPAGEHFATWDGSGAASGVYFYRVRAGAYSETRTLMLLR